MSIVGIKILFIDKEWLVPYETKLCCKTREITIELAQFKPDIIVTSISYPNILKLADFETRKKWLHVDENSSVESVINVIEHCYEFNIWTEHPMQSSNPLVSVYTGTYNTGDLLRDTYQSLREQTYNNWEWVVVDDGSIDGTWERLVNISNEDHRVRPVSITHSGKIGNVKDIATRLSNGEFLVELDHDDMLTDNALDEIKKAFINNPDVGMVYSNWSSFYEDGSMHQFNDDFWNPRYRETEYHNKKYMECISPNIYDRLGPNHWQIFGWGLLYGPNHVRAYRASTFKKLGGYNRHLIVADDWDLYARFFLRSNCLHIDKMLYLYRFLDNWQNTTFTHNKLIQDHLYISQMHYENEFIEVNKLLQNKKQLSVVILDWNTEDLTRQCIKSIEDNYPTSEIILIQNGKHFEYPNIKNIQLETNIGFAAGCNRGALEAVGEYICFLNSDTIVNSEVLTLLMNELVDDVGVVGPYTNQAKLPQGGKSKNDVTQTIDVEMVSGFCMMMQKDTFEEVGGFDTTFTNWEDDDICRRIKNTNKKCKIVGSAWIEHNEHSSFKVNKIDIENKMVTSQSFYKQKWPRIKIIVLTLNERNSLPEFFNQFRTITSEFAILDSGSTDGTIEWANDNGVEVKHRDFDRFDCQRNYALEMLGGDAEWIIMFDPDERLDIDMNNIWYLTRSNYDIFLAPLWAKNLDGSETEWVPKPFLFRNQPKIKWVFPVHEKLVGSHRQAIIKNIRITHHIEYHDSNRRSNMEKFYNKLESYKRKSTFKSYPILDYNKHDDDRIEKIFLGPLVSIVVPTYNRIELLNKAIASIDAQDYIAKEILIVGDNCPELKCFDNVSGCHIMNLPNNHGAGGAVPRNYAIMMSSSKYVAYLDDDNTWESNHLSSLMSCMVDGIDFCFSSMKVDNKELMCDRPEFGKIDTSCILHKKSLVSKFGWWKDHAESGYAHDWEIVSRWIDDNWAATRLPTVIYNIETCGQKEFLKNKLQR